MRRTSMFTPMARRLGLAACLLWPVLSSLRAQSQAARVQEVRDPTLSSPSNTERSIVLLTVAEKEKEVKASFSFIEATSTTGSENFALTAAGPIDEATRRAALLDESGLRGSTRFGLTYSRLFYNPGDNVDPLAIAAVCQKHLQKRGCTRQELPPAGKREFDLVNSFTGPTIIGITAEYGRKTFDFVDPADAALEAQSEEKDLYSVSFGVGKVVDRLRSLLSVSYRSGLSFNAGDEADLCRPLTGSTAMTCGTTVLGAPTSSRKSAFSLESRTFLNGVAVAPKYGYDFRAKRARVDLPLYMLRDSDGAFVGGVIVSWVQRQKRTGFTAFLGMPLGMKL